MSVRSCSISSSPAPSGASRGLCRLAAAVLLAAGFVAVPPGLRAQEAPRAVEGRVYDAATGRPVAGAVLELSPPRQRTRSDSAGGFRFRAGGTGRAVLRVRHPEYAPRDTAVEAGAAAGVSVALTARSFVLAPLTVRADQGGPEAERALFDREPTPGVIGVSRAELRDVPALAEPDVLRSLQAVPGVVLLNDLSAHLNVRGGGPDQNLFLLDGARVFAPYHVFGAFGAFNPDAVARADFFRGSVPARYGGALSSVVDLQQREGSDGGVSVDAGVSLLGARVTAAGGAPDGPARWMIAARRSDADLVMPRITGEEFPYAFHDAQGRFSATPGGSHRVQGSFFLSGDRYRMTSHGAEDDLLSRWRNGVGSLQWGWVSRAHWAVSATAWASTYGGELVSGSGPEAPATENDVRVGGLRLEVVRRGETSGLRAGVDVEGGRIALQGDDEPGSYVAGRAESDYVAPAAYAEVEQWLGRLRLTPGLRLVHDGRGGGLLVEPRLAGRVHLTRDVALTAGVGRSHQVVSSLRDDRHVLPGAPFWFVHPDGAPASTTDGASIALEGWRGEGWSFAMEGYARRFGDVPRWRPAGTRDLGDLRDIRYEDGQLTFDDGSAVGAELTLRRHTGTLTGWIGYGFSRVEMTETETGRTYAPAWDRRHAVDAALFYRPRQGLTFSGRAVYGSGLPFWPFAGYVTSPRLEPLAGGTREKGSIPVWAEEQQRYPAYARLDLSARYRFGVRGVQVEPFASLQNVTGRANVLYYRLQSVPAGSSALPTLVPETAFASTILPSIGIDVRF